VDLAGSFECKGAFIGYSCVRCVVMVCVFVVALLCTWSVGDISGGGQVHGGVLCVLGVCVCRASVSVSWVCPCVWGERRFDCAVFCVW